MTDQLKSMRFSFPIGLIFVVILGCMPFLHPQEKQMIPAEFFMGRWSGSFHGHLVSTSNNTYISKTGEPDRCIHHGLKETHYSVQISNGDAILQPFGLKGHFAVFPASNKQPGHAVMIRGKPHYEEALIQLLIDVGDKGAHDPLLMGLVSWLALEFPENRVDLKNGSIVINYSKEEKCRICGKVIEKAAINGTIHNVVKKSSNFSKDIKPNEPIKTDKKTQLEITLPSKDVIIVAQNTVAAVRSESLMEIAKGRIYGFFKRLKPRTKFDVHTPAAIVSVRGTEYEIYVEDDGTTTVVVLDGEVEFSDRENLKTIVVKRNQASVCKSQGLPSDPKEIDRDQILKWWE